MILDSGTKKFVFEKFVHFKKIFRISSNINFPQLFPRFLQLFFSQLLDRRHDSGERSKIRESQHRIINPIHIETIKLSKFCIEINTSLDTLVSPFESNPHRSTISPEKQFSSQQRESDTFAVSVSRRKRAISGVKNKSARDKSHPPLLVIGIPADPLLIFHCIRSGQRFYLSTRSNDVTP